jgi:hypothetical protein
MLVDLIVVTIIMTRVEVLTIRVVFERWSFTTDFIMQDLWPDEPHPQQQELTHVRMRMRQLPHPIPQSSRPSPFSVC